MAAIIRVITALIVYYCCLCVDAAYFQQFITKGGGGVAVNGDGTTLAMGDPNGNDNNNQSTGVVWTSTFSSSTWSEEGQVVGSGAILSNSTGSWVGQGSAVAVSADGYTLAFGGPGDNSNQGAVWVFTHSGSVWSQQQKLVGSGATGSLGHQGSAVALSFDGSTVAFGGPGDNSNQGAVWVFTHSG